MFLMIVVLMFWMIVLMMIVLMIVVLMFWMIVLMMIVLMIVCFDVFDDRFDVLMTVLMIWQSPRQQKCEVGISLT